MASDIDQESLGLLGADPATSDAEVLVDDGDPGPGRRVAVAIDAAGAAGAHPFTYRVPARLEPLLCEIMHAKCRHDKRIDEFRG